MFRNDSNSQLPYLHRSYEPEPDAATTHEAWLIGNLHYGGGEVHNSSMRERSFSLGEDLSLVSKLGQGNLVPVTIAMRSTRDNCDADT